MTKYLEKLRIEIMQKALLSEFPEKETEETKLWVRAIALIRKADGNYAYAIQRRKEDMTTQIVYANGSVAPIAETVEVYPYELLDKRYLKGFKGNATEPRIDYLKSLHLPYAENVDYTKMTFSELNKAIVGAAIYMQNNNNK